jgi:phosphatidylglycerol:prolipoprotein diacylglycerol transferase
MTSEKIQRYLTLNSDKIFETVGVSVDPNVPVHPCFLYEFIWCALGFLALHIYSKRRKFDGELFFMFIGWYGLGRFFNESLRTDSLMIGHIRVSQAVAGLSVIAAVAFITVMRIKIKKRGEYVFYRDTEESKALLKEAADRQEALKTKKALKKSEKAAALELKPEDRIVSAEEDGEETVSQQDSDE